MFTVTNYYLASIIKILNVSTQALFNSTVKVWQNIIHNDSNGFNAPSHATSFIVRFTIEFVTLLSSYVMILAASIIALTYYSHWDRPSILENAPFKDTPQILCCVYVCGTSWLRTQKTSREGYVWQVFLRILRCMR